MALHILVGISAIVQQLGQLSSGYLWLWKDLLCFSIIVRECRSGVFYLSLDLYQYKYKEGYIWIDRMETISGICGVREGRLPTAVQIRAQAGVWMQHLRYHSILSCRGKPIWSDHRSGICERGCSKGGEGLLPSSCLGEWSSTVCTLHPSERSRAPLLATSLCNWSYVEIKHWTSNLVPSNFAGWGISPQDKPHKTGCWWTGRRYFCVMRIHSSYSMH